MKMSDEERISMGERGYALCKKIFSWEVIARKTALLYEYLLNGGEKPEFVYD
jgi:poly(glycerol-phosphate) alpha-glucosyltransferase